VAALTVVLIVAALQMVHIDEVDTVASEPTPALAFDLLGERAVAGAVVLGAAAFLMIGAFDALWDVVHEDLGTPTWMANLGITLFGIPLILLGPFGGRLAQRVGPYSVAGVGLFLAAMFMAIYGQLPTGTWIFAVAMVHAITDGFTFSASGVAVSMAVADERQAGAQGLVGAAQALVGGIAAIVIGAVYDGFGRGTAYTVAAAGMAVLVMIGLALSAPLWRHRDGPGTPRPRLATGVGT
ncbi:MAG: MFS transporter, partial [Acidimicrobiales bacterium]|nr:MFS transporter [Acidimicrobiales bacterium]